MRSSKLVGSSKLVTLALCLSCLLAACGYDPVGTCQSQCQNAVAQECRPTDTDCVDVCAGEQVAYDNQRAESERLGCLEEFDAFVLCKAGADACEVSPCTPDGANLVICIQAYCAGHPTDDACS